ncbi:MAG: hypothetical protein AB8B68_04335 [Rickettsiaceae bacterium]
MKKKFLDSTGNSILLSEIIDTDYVISPGHRITFATGTTFQGVDVGGTTLYNNEYIIKKFVLDKSGKIQLTAVSHDLTEEDQYLFTTTPVEESKAKTDQSKALAPLILPPSSIPPYIDELNDDGLLFDLPMRIPLSYSHPPTPSTAEELYVYTPQRGLNLALISSDQDSPIETTLKLTFPSDIWDNPFALELFGEGATEFS